LHEFEANLLLQKQAIDTDPAKRRAKQHNEKAGEPDEYHLEDALLDDILQDDDDDDDDDIISSISHLKKSKKKKKKRKGKKKKSHESTTPTSANKTTAKKRTQIAEQDQWLSMPAVKQESSVRVYDDNLQEGAAVPEE